jgi:hypothetical protein
MRQFNSAYDFNDNAVSEETGKRKGPFSKSRQGQSRRNERARVRAAKSGL